LGLIALLGGVIVATSCSKSEKKTCECTFSTTIMGYETSQTVSSEHDGDCSDLENNLTGNMAQAAEELKALGGSVTVNCSEK
jgi:hypothetical protein